MKKLNKYKITYAKYTYKDIEIEAENREDANYIAKLKCPTGCEPILILETTESILEKVFSN